MPPTTENIPSLLPDIAAAFDVWPEPVQQVLLDIRARLYHLAAKDDRIGPLQECLKWGQPSWLTHKSKSGTTIRLGYDDATPNRAWIYVHCGTSLISDYKDRFGDQLQYKGKRAVALPLQDMPEGHLLDAALSMALLYHVNKKA